MRLVVVGEPSLDMVLRTLNCVAVRGIAPRHVEVAREDDRYTIAIEDEDVPPEVARSILEKVTALVSVRSVRYLR